MTQDRARLGRLPRLAFLAVAAALSLVAATASAQDATPAPLNAICPVMTDEAVDPEVWVDHDGRRVHLCCKMCQRKFQANPSAFLANLPPLANPPGEIAQSGAAPLGASTVEAAPTDSNAGAKEWVAELGVEPSDPPPGRLLVFLGKFHPVAAHFPIALLLAAFLAELLAVARPKWSTPREGARFCLWIGGPAAIVAAALGWLAGESWQEPGKIFLLHRITGTLTAVAGVAALLLSELARRRDAASSKGLWLGYRIALAMVAMLVAVAGHLGGLLLYGEDWFAF